MRLEIDPQERSVSFDVPKKLYTMDAVRITAQIFSSKADVYLDESTKAFALTLKAKRRDAAQPQLEALAGEFGNELLNQEYRFLVGRFNQKISSLIITQTLMAARGGEAVPAAAAEEQTPEFKAKTAKLMADAQAEVRRTMPKKIAPQGTPLPPVKEDAGV